MNQESQPTDACDFILTSEDQTAQKRYMNSVFARGLMAVGLFSVTFVPCGVLFARESSGRSKADSTEVSLTELRNCTSKMLKFQATADEGSVHDQATLALCDLFARLRADPRFDSSEMLRQDALKVRRRLLTEAKLRSARLKRSKIERPNGLSRDVQIALSASLPQQVTRSESEYNQGKPQATVTRPNVSAGAFAAGGAFDNGWQLVELIQQIVAPDFWQERGGAGTIRYFALRRVLVVSATTDVHEQIGDLLRMLSR